MGFGAKASDTQSTQTNVNSLSPTEQGWINQVMGASQNAAAQGPGAPITGASDYYTQLQNAGNVGVGAMSGNASDVQQLMNPYQGQVIDAMNNQWGNINAQTANQVNSNATSAGAFGGNRAAVAQGAALSQNNIAQAGQVGGLLSSGYQNAMTQAQALATGGAQAAGANAQLGLQGVGNSGLWQQLMLKQGLMGLPYGSSTGQSGNSFTGSAHFGTP